MKNSYSVVKAAKRLPVLILQIYPLLVKLKLGSQTWFIHQLSISQYILAKLITEN